MLLTDVLQKGLFLIQSYVYKLLSSEWLKIFLENSRTFEGTT